MVAQHTLTRLARFRSSLWRNEHKHDSTQDWLWMGFIKTYFYSLKLWKSVHEVTSLLLYIWHRQHCEILYICIFFGDESRVSFGRLNLTNRYTFLAERLINFCKLQGSRELWPTISRHCCFHHLKRNSSTMVCIQHKIRRHDNINACKQPALCIYSQTGRRQKGRGKVKEPTHTCTNSHSYKNLR